MRVLRLRPPKTIPLPLALDLDQNQKSDGDGDGGENIDYAKELRCPSECIRDEDAAA
jgi:hypothetical protein